MHFETYLRGLNFETLLIASVLAGVLALIIWAFSDIVHEINKNTQDGA